MASPPPDREIGWPSQTLERPMRIWRWGRAGKPILLFPTTSGDCNEVADFGLVGSVAPLIDAGRVRIYTVGCPLASIWLDRAAPGPAKSAALARWDAFLADEVVPRLLDDAGDPEAMCGAAGVNLGAHSAVTLAAKRPERFDLAIGMSGTYDLDSRMGGHFDEDYYYNQPIRFLPNLSGDALDRVRQALFVIATGRGRWEDPEQSIRLAHVLRAKAIPTSLEVWGSDAQHDWPTWRTMFPLFLERSV